jgi:hypothetical protein
MAELAQLAIISIQKLRPSTRAKGMSLLRTIQCRFTTIKDVNVFAIFVDANLSKDALSFRPLPRIAVYQESTGKPLTFVKGGVVNEPDVQAREIPTIAVIGPASSPTAQTLA